MSENIFKSVIENYDDSFYKIVKTLHEKNIINSLEYDFISEGDFSVRKIRNLFAHSNLSSINLEFNEEPGILYPLTENESCLKLYDKMSNIIFNIMLKVISEKLIVKFDIDLEEAIADLAVNYKMLSSSDILMLKGFSDKDIESFDRIEIQEETKIRLANDSSDVKVLANIFKSLNRD